MRRDNVRLFKTVEHACGYYPDRLAQNWVIDPQAPALAQAYGAALSQGFRRAGEHVYRPACAQCMACTPTRLAVAAFTPNRSQLRCLRSNVDLDISIEPASYSDEAYALYARYLSSRHRNGGMDATDPEDFSRFLYAPWSRTHFMMVRREGVLVACAVTDVVSSGLSAVYTFFDPDLRKRSLGVFAILNQIEWARRSGVPHLYLGFWIDGHPKMAYKTDYRPIEILRDGRWQQFDDADQAQASR